MNPEPFLRGRAFPGIPGVPYPRARPEDAPRLPADTWAQAKIPAGVRLELAGDAEEIEIAYETRTDELGHRGEGAGRTFAVWRGGAPVDEEKAQLGEGRVRLRLAAGGGRAIVYLPEGMKPVIVDVVPLGGRIEPPPPQPRWVAYGDSILEGWCASAPALAWPAIAAREHGLDVVNLGYAGAARGEIVSAEHVARLDADVISITHGTNCWTRIPHSPGMFREGLLAFLGVVRQARPETPVLVSSPTLRPDAEDTPNRLGATLDDLRGVMEEVAARRIEAGDHRLRLVPGRDLVDETMLPDGIHPNDEGHRAIAGALGPVLAEMIR